jgi:hypothetical protein
VASVVFSCDGVWWVRVTDEAKRRSWGYGACRAALSFEDL